MSQSSIQFPQNLLKNLLSQNHQLDEIPQKDKKLMMLQFQKIYSQQMSKITHLLSKRNQVLTHKSQIQLKKQKQIECIAQQIHNKMDKYQRKRQKIFSSKQSQYKIKDQLWKYKIQQIQKRKKIQFNNSMKRALQYRKESETFSSQKVRKIQVNMPVIQSQDYFSIKPQNDKRVDKTSLQKKFKSVSNNQLVSSKVTTGHTSTLPKIQKSFENKQTNPQIERNSHSKQTSIRYHIEKSKSIQALKEQMILNSAMQTLKKIQIKRKKCKQNLQKSVKQARLKREIRQQVSLHASKSRQQLPKSTLSNPAQKQSKSLHQHIALNKLPNKNSSQLNKLQQQRLNKARQKISQQEALDREQVYKSFVLKEKKGKVFRMLRGAINRIKHQTLST